MKRALATYAAIFQIVAVLLLQCHSFGPYSSRKLLKPQCHGNHVECGCLPERIAARSCCCDQHKPERRNACPQCAQHREDEPEANPALHHLSTAPCGDTPTFIAASLDKIDYLHSVTLPLTPSFYCDRLLGGCVKANPSRFPEPPDPPPELPTFS